MKMNTSSNQNLKSSPVAQQALLEAAMNALNRPNVEFSKCSYENAVIFTNKEDGAQYQIICIDGQTLRFVHAVDLDVIAANSERTADQLASSIFNHFPWEASKHPKAPNILMLAGTFLSPQSSDAKYVEAVIWSSACVFWANVQSAVGGALTNFGNSNPTPSVSLGFCRN